MGALKTITVSLLSGLAGMLALWAVAFVLAPSVAAAIFYWPGVQVLPVAAAMVPDSMVYSLWPEGGLDATAGIVALSASVLWWSVGALIVYFLFRARRRDEKQKSP
jgi:hypothetical protein